MTRNIPRLLLMGALLFPATLYALGLGEIHLNSALSQPFDAEVELLSATPEELSSLRVGLASVESFERAGLDRSQFLTGFVFRVVPAGNGRNVIRITSTRAISEPVVSLLLEASWGNGRVQREYTVFLDPPVFVPVQPAPAPVDETRPVAPPPTDQSRTQGVIERPAEPPAPEPETIAVPAPQVPPPTAEAPPAEPPPTTAAVPPTAEVAEPTPLPEPAPPETVPAPSLSGDTYDVQRNDSLWKIASRLRPGTPQSINQTMIALYRANPAAFAGNINRLRAGAVLRVPPPEEIEAVDTQGATEEVARQYSEWRPEATVAEARDHLRLVTPQETATPVESAAAAEAERVKQAQAEQARAEAEKAKVEEEARVAAAARKLAEEAEAKRLLDLKNAELARMQQEREARAAAEAEAAKAAETAKAAEAEKAAQTQEPAPAEPAAEVAAAPAEPAEVTPAETQPEPAPAADEPSFTDTLAGLPWTMIAGGVGILALLGGWFVYSRKRQQSTPSSLHFPMPDAGVPTMTPGDFDAAMAEPTKTRSRAQPAFDSGVMDEPDSIPEAEGTKPLHSGPPPEEFEQPTAARAARSADDTMSSETAIHTDQADAVAEADFHMAYGLYDQAADLVKIAIGREPKRRDLKLKLLEIYFVWGNKELFLDTARDLHSSRTQAPAGEWDKILIMGKQIAPDDALFRGGAVASPGDMLDVNLEGGENRVDFDLFSTPDAGDAESASLDFEIGNTGARAKPSSHLDFLLDDSGNAQLADDDTREMDANARTQETPTIESPVLRREESRDPTVEMNFGDHTSEQTAELSIDDLGLDVSSLEGTGSLERTTALKDARADVLPGHKDEDIADDEMTRIAPAGALPPKAKSASSLEPTMEMPQVKLDAPRAKSGNGHDEHVDDDGEESGVSTIYLEQMEGPTGEVVESLGPRTDETAHMLSPAELDLDLAQLSETDASDDDTIRTKARKLADDATAEMPAVRRPDTAATAEQPRPKIDRSDMLVATSELPEMEPVTMSEVGTKLDLARAYMDMGDPDGARSILEEVLGEGNSGQKAEAQRLLDSIR